MHLDEERPGLLRAWRLWSCSYSGYLLHCRRSQRKQLMRRRKKRPGGHPFSCRAISTAGLQDWLKAPSTSKKTTTSGRLRWIARRPAFVNSSSPTAPSTHVLVWAESMLVLVKPAPALRPPQQPRRWHTYPPGSCSQLRAGPEACTPSSSAYSPSCRSLRSLAHPPPSSPGGNIAEVLAGIGHVSQMMRGNVVSTLFEHPPCHDHVRAGGRIATPLNHFPADLPHGERPVVLVR